MNFAHYATAALTLANLEPHGAPDDEAIRSFVATSFRFHADRCGPDDVALLRACHVAVREVMLAPDARSAVDRANALMREHPLCPTIVDHDEPGEVGQMVPERHPGWHFHLVADTESPGRQMAGAMSMGLMSELLATGLDRRGACAHDACEDVYLDASPGGTRRYCDGVCQNRANVAAHRARKRAQARAEQQA